MMATHSLRGTALQVWRKNFQVFVEKVVWNHVHQSGSTYVNSNFEKNVNFQVEFKFPYLIEEIGNQISLTGLRFAHTNL